MYALAAVPSLVLQVFARLFGLLQEDNYFETACGALEAAAKRVCSLTDDQR
jgi:hypothetical protein